MKSIDPTLGLRIEDVCTRFKKAWRTGDPPRIEDSLAGWQGEERAALLRELVRLDMDHRRKAGESVTLADYTQRFPDLADNGETRPLALAAEEAALPPAVDATTETLALEPAAAGTVPGLLPPGYELLGELGRGGMGVVYQAKHVKLNRICAVKMILAGDHAGAAARQRFEAEAQAIARLQHAGIVQVFEVGEHDGLPFMALEFCPGGSLEKRLRDQPPTPREAAGMVRDLAEAMQAAHAANVVHRDLKPANVLIAADGSLKITDFGLAKKLDEAGQTHTGAVMGTPSYMPPEQARGAKDLGPRVDVYALGAILYECLAGRPPFRGATVLETLTQVLNNEPVGVRQLNPSVPRDLETVCLKCLQKDPAKRYASAQELADDLGRFLRGEPIQARPVGSLERAYRWVKRNPVVSGLVAAVLLLLTSGITLTTILAVAEARARGQAEQETATAVAARNDLQKAHSALQESTDSLVTSLARGLVRPLAAQAQPNLALPPLGEAEIEALWELAAAKDERLRPRFVEQALSDPILTRQLTDRATFALHAAVGLDGTRRREVERLLGQALAVKEGSPDQWRVALCLAGLGELDPELAGRTAAVLNQPRRQLPDRIAELSQVQGVATVASCLPAKEALTGLVRALERTIFADELQALSQGLSAAAARLQPEEAAEVADLLTQAMTRTAAMKPARPAALASLAETVAVLATRLPEKEATAVCGRAADIVIEAVTQNDPGPDPLWPGRTAAALTSGARGLTALAPHLEPKQAAQAAAALTQGLTKTRDLPALRSLARSLAPVTGRLEAKDAAAELTQAMTQTTDPDTLLSLAQALSATAARLEAREAAGVCRQAADGLTMPFTRAVGPASGTTLGRCLLALAVHLEPAETAAMHDQVAPTLTRFLTRTKWGLLGSDSASLGPLAETMAAVAACREAKDAAAGLADAMAQTTNPEGLKALAGILATVARRLEPAEAATVRGRAAAAITQALVKTTDVTVLGTLADGLVAVADGLESTDAAASAAALTQALTQATSHFAVPQLGRALMAVLPRLEAKDAAVAATALAEPLTRTPSGWHAVVLADGLAAVAPRLEPGPAAEVAAALAQTITPQTKLFLLGYLARGLGAVAARLDAKEAAVVCRPAADILARAVAETLDPDPQGALAEGLAALARRLEPAEAAAVCRPVAATLTRAVTQKTDLGSLVVLTDGLVALAACLDEAEAAAARSAAAGVLARALAREGHQNPFAYGQLVPRLLTLAARLDKKDAAAACGPAAAAVLQALPRLADWRDGPPLARHLAALSAYLEEKEAAAVPGQAAAGLLQALARTTDVKATSGLTQLLAEVLSREPATARPATLAATVAMLGTPAMPLGALAVARPLGASPPPLPAQTLVDLLKNPFCVGDARRLVLEQLSRHYHRPFADQWEFVEYVQQNKLDLDLTTPPERPGAGAASR